MNLEYGIIFTTTHHAHLELSTEQYITVDRSGLVYKIEV
jgi:hypothetical protein